MIWKIVCKHIGGFDCSLEAVLIILIKELLNVGLKEKRNERKLSDACPEYLKVILSETQGIVQKEFAN